jgi:5-amino-6-(5-phosphoribosylamino)uracil reductase
VTERAGATERAGDRELLREAIALAARCPPSSTFRVGAVVVDAAGEVLARGWSGRRQPADHAEEAALAELVDDPRVRGGTIFSSLEPCSVRKSRVTSCTRHILDAGLARVVYAWREPALFVDCEGDELLRAAGLDVVELPDLAPLVRRENAHLPGVDGDGSAPNRIPPGAEPLGGAADHCGM